MRREVGGTRADGRPHMGVAPYAFLTTDPPLPRFVILRALAEWRRLRARRSRWPWGGESACGCDAAFQDLYFTMIQVSTEALALGNNTRSACER